MKYNDFRRQTRKITVGNLTIGKRFQQVRVDQHFFRLIESSDNIFYTTEIYCCFSSDFFFLNCLKKSFIMQLHSSCINPISISVK